jgi:hypothetical protein
MINPEYLGRQDARCTADNALAETINGLYKTAHTQRPHRTRKAVGTLHSLERARQIPEPGFRMSSGSSACLIRRLRSITSGPR